MSEKNAPLVHRKPDEPIAYIGRTPNLNKLSEGVITSSQFLSHVKQLASTLPNHRYAINLCENRYLFMVALCAAIIRGQTNLLPPNAQDATLKQLAGRYKNCYILHDNQKVIENTEHIDLTEIHFLSNNTDFDIPSIPYDHLAAISFTSGSTGESKPSLKTWQTLVISTHINRAYMIPEGEETLFLLSTVPSQHMWGLETSILLPLHTNVCICDSRPLYPYDIHRQLKRLPTPRILISTPVHLRALIQENLDYPKINTILCATAPLSLELAKNAEKTFDSDLREIYGCSEIGSIAVRRTASEKEWQRFSDIHFEDCGESEVIAKAQHISQPIKLNDRIIILDDDRFRLIGRDSDIINIAGKRGSLYEINQLLQNFSGIRDGVIFLPPQEKTVPRLVAIVVLDNQSSKEKLITYLKEHLDNAFIPRPIIEIASLPREQNGKLSQKKLYELYRSLKES